MAAPRIITVQDVEQREPPPSYDSLFGEPHSANVSSQTVNASGNQEQPPSYDGGVDNAAFQGSTSTAEHPLNAGSSKNAEVERESIQAEQEAAARQRAEREATAARQRAEREARERREREAAAAEEQRRQAERKKTLVDILIKHRKEASDANDFNGRVHRLICKSNRMSVFFVFYLLVSISTFVFGIYHTATCRSDSVAPQVLMIVHGFFMILLLIGMLLGNVVIKRRKANLDALFPLPKLVGCGFFMLFIAVLGTAIAGIVNTASMKNIDRDCEKVLFGHALAISIIYPALIIVYGMSMMITIWIINGCVREE